MKFVLAASAAAFLAVGATPAAAQIALEANAARSEGQWGAEVGAGYSLISIGGFRMTPAIGLFISDKRDDRYVLEPGAGDPLCRDTSTGGIADEDRCDRTGTEFYARVEATYTLPMAGITVGPGARFIDGSLRPYGTVSVPLVPMLHMKGNAGPKYLAAGVAARF